jgi:hypothetical protein
METLFPPEMYNHISRRELSKSLCSAGFILNPNDSHVSVGYGLPYGIEDFIYAVASRRGSQKAIDAASPPTHLARRDDPDTSQNAATVNPHGKKKQRHLIYLFAVKCGEYGMTAYEASVATGIQKGSASPRIRELVIAGLLKDSGRRRKTDSKNCTAIVWVVTNGDMI